jgi:hypothetical protein
VIEPSAGDHNALAKHYADATREMQLKADEHKKLPAQYQAREDLYGKHAQDLIDHCQDLVRIEKQAAAENMNTAAHL